MRTPMLAEVWQRNAKSGPKEPKSSAIWLNLSLTWDLRLARTPAKHKSCQGLGRSQTQVRLDLGIAWLDLALAWQMLGMHGNQPACESPNHPQGWPQSSLTWA